MSYTLEIKVVPVYTQTISEIAENERRYRQEGDNETIISRLKDTQKDFKQQEVI